MRNRLIVACCVGLAAWGLAGCDGDDSDRDSGAAVAPAAAPSVQQDPIAPSVPTTAPSEATTTPAAGPRLVTPGKLGALLVPIEELNDLVGTKLGFETVFTRPGTPAGGLGDKSGCAVLFGSNTDSYANEYTAFRRVSVRDGEDSSQHFVAQEVATFADVATATENFGKAFDKNALAGCDGAVVHRQGDDDRITWRLNLAGVTADTARWTLTQLADSKPNDWTCAHEARTRSNVEFTVTVCQFGNAAPAATAIGNQIADWIPQP
ncbi:sensor domain-containing protein [[Mycobacterium] nativiensis]|uniref:Sensor domain-containing protein n=1 Tax=[Mycobacterium] nativiensis TaxID=2855503 RepID=A0ABU5Y138_9MYCO|nr:sensor domain-containing protein [Mycolicibacter sp. MYC340]MEB3033964.1 sensor domain-containing protein [Mycolicibacter sp. MYC340]